MIDHRNLLKLYMQGVERWEGTNFLDMIDTSELTVDEEAELLRIADEIDSERPVQVCRNKSYEPVIMVEAIDPRVRIIEVPRGKAGIL
jgi:hypothetical protein